MPATTQQRKQRLEGPNLHREIRASIANFDTKTRAFDLTFASDDVKVRRSNWFDGPWDEVLGLDPAECDLTRLASGAAPLLWDHDDYQRDNLIGVVNSAQLRDGRGYANVRLSMRADLDDLARDIADGIVTNVSVGYQVQERVLTQDNGDDGVPEYRVTRWLPMEISLVAIPADDTVGVGRSKKNDAPQRFTITDIEDTTMPAKPGQPADNTTTRSAGNNAAAATDDNASSQTQERPNGTTVVEATERPATGTESTHEERRAAPAPEVQTAVAEALRADRARTGSIRSIALEHGLGDEFISRHAESTVEVARTNALELLAARSVSGQPTPMRISGGEANLQKRAAHITDWLLARCGYAKNGQDAINLAGNPFRNATLVDIAADCVRNAGGRIDTFDRMEIAKRAITHSTSDFAIIMGQVFNKVLLAAYSIVPDTWRQFSKVGSLPDFRAGNRYRMGGMGNLALVPEGGEYTYATLADAEKNTIQLYTYGKMFSLTRQAIVNDDMGALNDILAIMGRSAKRTIEAAVYALLALNSGAGPTMGDGNALFSSAHGNLTSPGTAPTVASIQGEVQAMASQQFNNDYIDIRPSIALSTLPVAAIIESFNTNLYDITGGSVTQKSNPVKGTYSSIVGTPRLSGTAWYSFADPNLEPVIEVDFLNGNETPFTEQRDGWNVDGIEYKIRHDFGVAAVGYRGARKNPGA